MVKPLSKSRYLLGLRCHKLLWLDEHKHDDAPPDATRARRRARARVKVQGGGTAMALLAKLLVRPEEIGGDDAVQSVRSDLLAYCERDTDAMVRLAEALRAIA